MVRHIDLNLFHPLPFTFNTKEIVQEHYFKQSNWDNGWTTVILTIKVSNLITDKFKINGSSDLANKGAWGTNCSRIIISTSY